MSEFAWEEVGHWVYARVIEKEVMDVAAWIMPLNIHSGDGASLELSMKMNAHLEQYSVLIHFQMFLVK